VGIEAVQASRGDQGVEDGGAAAADGATIESVKIAA
jgi:hypothetical protein